ncbi:Serine/threonine-protein kinase SRPK [Diplonema papillatum]|nr:Serine/threonine-protein kinase SRPK [Diplonema papillatum]
MEGYHSEARSKQKRGVYQSPVAVVKGSGGRLENHKAADGSVGGKVVTSPPRLTFAGGGGLRATVGPPAGGQKLAAVQAAVPLAFQTGPRSQATFPRQVHPSISPQNPAALRKLVHQQQLPSPIRTRTPPPLFPSPFHTPSSAAHSRPERTRSPASKTAPPRSHSNHTPAAHREAESERHPPHTHRPESDREMAAEKMPSFASTTVSTTQNFSQGWHSGGTHNGNAGGAPLIGTAASTPNSTDSSLTGDRSPPGGVRLAGKPIGVHRSNSGRTPRKRSAPAACRAGRPLSPASIPSKSPKSVRTARQPLSATAPAARANGNGTPVPRSLTAAPGIPDDSPGRNAASHRHTAPAKPGARDQFVIGSRVIISSRLGPTREGVVQAVCFGSLKVSLASGASVVVNKGACTLDPDAKSKSPSRSTSPPTGRATSKDRHPLPRYKPYQPALNPQHRGSSLDRVRSSSKERSGRHGSPTRKGSLTTQGAIPGVSRAHRRSATDTHLTPKRREKSPGPPGSVGAPAGGGASSARRPKSDVSCHMQKPRGRAASRAGLAVRSGSSRGRSAHSRSHTQSHLAPSQRAHPRRALSLPSASSGIHVPPSINYGEGGYSNVFVGDVLNDRYLLLSQLGCGQSSTVWLAKDINCPPGHRYKHVAIKVTRCSKTVRFSSLHEVALLYYIANNSRVCDIERYGGAARLLDHFEYEGQHGVHVCMIFELLGHSMDVLMETGFRGIADVTLVKQVTASILRTLSELKRINVVHTDLKPENLMFTKPSSDVLSVIRSAQTHTPRARTSSQTHQRPKPLQSRISMHKLLKDLKEQQRVRLSDFGLSFLLRPDSGVRYDGEPLSDVDLRLIKASNYVKGALIQTREYRAPEIILGNDFTCETDIWSLGCIVYEMLTGRFLFDPKSKPDVHDEVSNDAEHLSEISQVIGRPQERVLTSGGVYVSKFYDIGSTVLKGEHTYAMPDAVGQLAKRCSKQEAREAWDFIRSCLTWSPTDRPTAPECLRHPWLRGVVSDTACSPAASDDEKDAEPRSAESPVEIRIENEFQILVEDEIQIRIDYDQSND